MDATRASAIMKQTRAAPSSSRLQRGIWPRPHRREEHLASHATCGRNRCHTCHAELDPSPPSDPLYIICPDHCKARRRKEATVAHCDSLICNSDSPTEANGNPSPFRFPFQKVVILFGRTTRASVESDWKMGIRAFRGSEIVCLTEWPRRNAGPTPCLAGPLISLPTMARRRRRRPRGCLFFPIIAQLFFCFAG